MKDKFFTFLVLCLVCFTVLRVSGYTVVYDEKTIVRLEKKNETPTQKTATTLKECRTMVLDDMGSYIPKSPLTFNAMQSRLKKVGFDVTEYTTQQAIIDEYKKALRELWNYTDTQTDRLQEMVEKNLYTSCYTAMLEVQGVTVYIQAVQYPSLKERNKNTAPKPIGFETVEGCENREVIDSYVDDLSILRTEYSSKEKSAVSDVLAYYIEGGTDDTFYFTLSLSCFSSDMDKAFGLSGYINTLLKSLGCY